MAILRDEPMFEVVADVANGQELIDVVNKLQAPPDVCLIDINMPEKDGYDTLITLKGKYPKMKFLVLSMHAHEFVIIKMLKNGANGYLSKDAETAELKDAIRGVYEQPYYHSELVSGHLISMVQRGEAYTKLYLNDKEQEFLKYACSDLTYKQIAEQMKMSRRTVEGYRENLFRKLDVQSRTGLAIFALKLGLTSMYDVE